MTRPRLMFRNAFAQAERRRRLEWTLIAIGAAALVGLPFLLLVLGASPLVFGSQQMLAFVAYLAGHEGAEGLRRYVAALKAYPSQDQRRDLARRLAINFAVLFVVTASSLLLSAWQATEINHRPVPPPAAALAGPTGGAAKPMAMAPVTQERLDRIRVGQSMGEVRAIFPNAGALQSRSAYANAGLVEVYQWINPDHSGVNIEFHNGKVSDIRPIYK